jgi:5,10-methylenetetrahydromethanopterin reductase
MRIGMYRGDAMAGPIESLIDAARETDDAGFASLWLAEAMGMDAMTALAVVGREVPRIELGIAVVPTYPRHPIVMAQQALTTQSITGGRFVLGIGVSHPPIIENAYGYPFERPARHMREYLDALLPLVRDGRVDAEGETITARMTLNVRDASPVRVVVFMTGSATLANHVVPRIRGAAESAGRPDPMIGAAYSVCVTDDADAARAAIDKRYEMIAALPSYRAMLEREGATRAADVHLVGDEASVRDQVEMLDELGVTDLVASIVGSPEERDRTRALLATLTQASK